MRLVEVVIILGMALVTFSIRALLLVFSDQISLGSGWRRALGFVPPAVLTAITVPALLLPAGYLNISLSNHYLLSGAAALTAGLIFRRHALWAAIITGLIVFSLWTLFYR